MTVSDSVERDGANTQEGRRLGPSTVSWILYCASLVAVALVAEAVPFTGKAGMFAAGGRPALRIFVLALPMAISAVMWAMGLLRGTVKFRFTPSLWALAVLCGLVAASTAMAVARRVALFGYWLNEQGLIMWVVFFALAFLGSQLVSSRSRLRQLTASIVGAASVVAALALLEVAGLRPFPGYSDSVGWMFQRGASTMVNPDFLGTFLVLPAVLSVALAAERAGRQRWVAAAAAAVIWLSLMYSLTRGALIGAFVGLIAFGIMRFVLARRAAGSAKTGPRAGVSALRAAAPWVLVAVILVVGLSALGADTIRQRIAETYSEIGSSSFDLSGRLPIWRELLPAVGSRPIFGSGADNILFAWQHFAGTYSLSTLGVHALVDSAHNLYLDLAVQFGIAFPIVLVGVVGWLIVAVVRRTGGGIASGSTNGRLELGWVAAIIGTGIAFITGITIVPVLAYAFAGIGVLMALDVRAIRRPERQVAVGVAVGTTVLGMLVAVFALLSGLSAVAGNQYASTPMQRAQRNLAALKLAPWRQFAAYDLLASVQMLTPEEQQAIGVTISDGHQRILAIDGHDAARLYDAGDHAFLVERDPVKTMEYANKSLALRPGYAASLMLKGDALYAMQRPDEASGYFAQAMETESRSGSLYRWEAPWLSYINFLANQGRYDSAGAIESKAVLERFKQRFPESKSIPDLERLVSGS